MLWVSILIGVVLVIIVVIHDVMAAMDQRWLYRVVSQRDMDRVHDYNIPWWQCVAWYRYHTLQTVLMPMGLNLVCKWARSAYWWVRNPYRWHRAEDRDPALIRDREALLRRQGLFVSFWAAYQAAVDQADKKTYAESLNKLCRGDPVSIYGPEPFVRDKE